MIHIIPTRMLSHGLLFFIIPHMHIGLLTVQFHNPIFISQQMTLRVGVMIASDAKQRYAHALRGMITLVSSGARTSSHSGYDYPYALLLGGLLCWRLLGVLGYIASDWSIIVRIVTRVAVVISLRLIWRLGSPLAPQAAPPGAVCLCFYRTVERR